MDLQNLPALRRLAFDETLPIRASVAPSLEDLTVEGLDSYWAGNLPMMSGLRKLQLIRPRTLPATLPPSIRTFDLACARQWDPTFSFSGGTAVELLSLVDIRGMRDLRAFATLARVKRLYVEDCPELESLEGLELADDARCLFVGRTPLRQDRSAGWQAPPGR